MSDLTFNVNAVNNAASFSAPSKRDPLDQIDRMLARYMTHMTNRAEALANEISEKSKATAEINRLWGTLMTASISKLDPTKTGKTTNIRTNSTTAYDNIDKIIRNTLQDSKGISVITNGNTFVNYDQLQSMNATMTAYTDTIQVDIDKLQQDFKNLMTTITSAQEEIRNVRQAVVAISQRS